MPVRLVVLDVDGVLSQVDGDGLDLPLLEQLSRMNRAAWEDPDRPAVTLCTGRSAAATEALLQAMHGRVPAVFENGAGLYVPDGYAFLPHPELAGRPPFQAIRQRLEEALVRAGRAVFQPGKEYSLSLVPRNPAEAGALYEQAAGALGSLRDVVDLVYSVSCLNVLPRGLSKREGIEFLAQQAGYQVAEMLGVGDSDVDLLFLARVGHSAAPANANEQVRRSVQYVSAYPRADGVRDILGHFGLG
jgi:hypothetical protein